MIERSGAQRTSSLISAGSMTMRSQALLCQTFIGIGCLKDACNFANDGTVAVHAFEKEAMSCNSSIYPHIPNTPFESYTLFCVYCTVALLAIKFIYLQRESKAVLVAHPARLVDGVLSAARGGIVGCQLLRSQVLPSAALTDCPKPPATEQSTITEIQSQTM